MLEIFVYKEPELTRKVLVRPDGRISFPLVQDLQAAGINPGELKDRIENELQTYLNAPSVTVIVDAIQSYRIFVVGKVQNPGAYMSEKPITVLQSLAFAGGFQEFADESGMTIVRTSGGKSTVMGFNYKNVIKGKNTEQNIYLKSGDVVVVP
ncbi:MAG: polysaccharide export protein [Acidobacteriota bacterium]